MNWYSIVGILITLGVTVFGTGYFTKFKILVKEIREAFQVLEDALADDKITPEELRKVALEFLDIVKVIKP
jgi:hypothetical protein|tara:strand:+ start:1759 stop:1971 length:213 start_codon:yes stop_codon:yes gene_type:complete